MIECNLLTSRIIIVIIILFSLLSQLFLSTSGNFVPVNEGACLAMPIQSKEVVIPPHLLQQQAVIG